MNEEEQIASMGFMNTDPYPDEEQLETKDGKPVFAAPFGYTFGNSSVDLNVKENHDTMKDEYNAYWNLPRGQEKDTAQEAFNQKYFGMSTEEVRANQRQINLDANNPLKKLDSTFQSLLPYGLGTADFVMDAAGTLIPGMDKVDDWWDKKTKLDSPTNQAIRRLSSLVIPGILGGNVVQGSLNAKFAGGALLSKPWFQKLL